MTQLIENTYLAYEQFLEGELNEYDLMSLIEDEIISGELLDSIMEESCEELEEGRIAKIGLGLGVAAAAAAPFGYHDMVNKNQDAVYMARAHADNIQKDINKTKGSGSFSKNVGAAYDSAKNLDAGDTWKYSKGAGKATYATSKNYITDTVGSTNISDKLAKMAQHRDELRKMADDHQKRVDNMRKYDVVYKGKKILSNLMSKK